MKEKEEKIRIVLYECKEGFIDVDEAYRKLSAYYRQKLEEARWTDADMIEFVKFYKENNYGKYVALEEFKRNLTQTKP